MSYTVRRLEKKDFKSIMSYINKHKKKYKIKLSEPEVVVYMKDGMIIGIVNDSGKLEGLCIAMKSKNTNGVFVPFIKIDSKHTANFTSYIMLMEIAKYVKDRKIVMQFDKEMKSKYLINCGENIYTINIPLALNNSVYRFINDTFLNPIDMDIEQEILEFQREYANIFPNEIQPSTTILKRLRKICTIKLETKNLLIYLKKNEDEYDILGMWCIANNNRNNINIHKEYRNFVFGLDMPISDKSININMNYKFLEYVKKINKLYLKNIQKKG